MKTKMRPLWMTPMKRRLCRERVDWRMPWWWRREVDGWWARAFDVVCPPSWSLQYLLDLTISFSPLSRPHHSIKCLAKKCRRRHEAAGNHKILWTYIGHLHQVVVASSNRISSNWHCSYPWCLTSISNILSLFYHIIKKICIITPHW